MLCTSLKRQNFNPDNKSLLTMYESTGLNSRCECRKLGDSGQITEIL